jgi:hypothetical protein
VEVLKKFETLASLILLGEETKEDSFFELAKSNQKGGETRPKEKNAPGPRRLGAWLPFFCPFCAISRIFSPHKCDSSQKIKKRLKKAYFELKQLSLKVNTL